MTPISFVTGNLLWERNRSEKHKKTRISFFFRHNLFFHAAITRYVLFSAYSNEYSLTIKLEQLANIRRTTRTSRKNNHSLHTWSFYRLAHYIEYKAKLLGIQVEYVDPAYTSQTCPVCGQRHKTNSRDYHCSCGYHTHRDLVGAKNICAA